MARPHEIREACAKVVAKLPHDFRAAVLKDAEALVGMLLRLCHQSYRLTVQLEIVGNNCCKRWHQDQYVARGIATYVGPGTWMVDDKWVRYGEFAATLGQPKEVSDPRIVPRFDRVTQTPPNSVVLIKVYPIIRWLLLKQ